MINVIAFLKMRRNRARRESLPGRLLDRAHMERIVRRITGEALSEARPRFVVIAPEQPQPWRH